MRYTVFFIAIAIFMAAPCLAQLRASAGLTPKERSTFIDEVLSEAEVAARPELRQSLVNYYNRDSSGAPRLSRLELQRMFGHWSMPDMRMMQAKREAQLKRLDEISKAQAAPVVKHIRGRNGISFPEKQPAVEVAKFLESPSYRAAVKIYQKAISKESMLTKVSTPKLPKCSSNRSIQMPMQNASGTDTDTKLLDMLYLDFETPLDSAEIFGQRTFVHQFTTKENDYISALSGTLGVTCLPFRIRQTTSGVVWDLGINALKNYDSADDSGEGTLHPYIKAKFNIP